jgi:ACR3 family arsenite transporter
VSSVAAETHEPAVVERLSLLDRFLPVWILAAMGLGLALGALVPRLNEGLSSVQVSGTSLPSPSDCC